MAHPASFSKRLAHIASPGPTAGTDWIGAPMDIPTYRIAAPCIGSHVFAPNTVAGIDLSRIHAMLETPMKLILGYNTLR